MRTFATAFLAVAALAGLVLAGTASVAAGADELGAVRQATARFHDFDKANAAGYDIFYRCTDEEGVGAMGQHYVNFAIVGDAILDPAQPEAIMYEPKPGGGQQLVGVEWVVFKAVWEAAGNTQPPVLFGRPLQLVPAGNRYGIDPFYELHAWIWRPNPTGIHSDWNPNVSCIGTGD